MLDKVDRREVVDVLPFSHRLLCREPSLPFRRASRRSSESRRRILRVVDTDDLLSNGTDNLTDWPRTRVGDGRSGVVGVGFVLVSCGEVATFASKLTTASDLVIDCIMGTM